MPDDKQWLLDTFRDITKTVVDDTDTVEEHASTLYERYTANDFEGALSFLEEMEDEYGASYGSLKTYFENILDDDLIQTQDDRSTEKTIDSADRRALMAKMSQVPDKKVVGKVQAPASQRSLNRLSQDIYKKHNKLSFFISPTTTISGEVRQRLKQNKESLDLLRVCEPTENDNGEFAFIHFGEKKGKKQEIDKLTGDFYSYKFIANDKEYVVFSQNEIDTGRVDITGTVFSLDDATTVGENRKLSKSTDVIFCHSSDPAIEPLTDGEIADIKPEIDHDWLAKRFFGGWRQPPLYEKMIMAMMVVKDENSYPSHLIQIGEPGTGKSYMMEALMTSMDERQDMMRGEQSTIKGMIPSFSQEPPDPGYLAKCHRVGCVDEFFNLLDDTQTKAEKQKVFRKLLTLLEHRPSNATSGNGNISVQLESTMIASTNSANGVDDVVQMAQELDEAFLSRCIVYQFTENHKQFIESRKSTVKKLASKEGGENALFPDLDDLFVSLVDTLRERVSLLDQIDFDRTDSIKEDLKHIVPHQLHDVYRARYDHHMENILLGVAKLNSLIDDRDEFTIEDKDYDEMRSIMEFILQSWKPNPSKNIEALSPEARLAYMRRSEADLFRLVEKQSKMTMDQIVRYTDDDHIEAKAEKLVEVGLLKEIESGGDTYLAPHWYSYGD
jgi:hypothetical protein